MITDGGPGMLQEPLVGARWAVACMLTGGSALEAAFRRTGERGGHARVNATVAHAKRTDDKRWSRQSRTRLKRSEGLPLRLAALLSAWWTVAVPTCGAESHASRPARPTLANAVRRVRVRLRASLRRTQRRPSPKSTASARNATTQRATFGNSSRCREQHCAQHTQDWQDSPVAH